MRSHGLLRRRRLLGALASSLALVATGPWAQQRDDAGDLRLSVATGTALPLGHAAERWAALLGEGALRLPVKLRPGAAVAHRDPARELLALKEGAADLAVGSALQWSMQLPSLAVFSLPWIAPQDDELVALTSDESIEGVLAERMAASGVVLVAVAPLGYREIATVSHAIRAPDDLKGLRLRASSLPLLHDLLLALGALPQGMSFRDAQAAFAAGTLDGQESSPSALATSKAGANRHRYLTDWGGVADAMLFAVRKPVWDAWTEAQREQVRAAAEAAIGDSDALARDAAAVAQLQRNGVSVVRITPAGHAAFRAAAANVDARWREAVGADVVALAERIVARQRESRPGKQ